MLQPEDEQEVQVTREDQDNINAFSKLTTQVGQKDAELEKLLVEKDYLEELYTELELADEDEKVSYKVGDSFIDLDLAEAMERLQKEMENIQTKLEDTKAFIESGNANLVELKARLYSKFGNSIHLERD